MAAEAHDTLAVGELAVSMLPCSRGALSPSHSGYSFLTRPVASVPRGSSDC